MQSPSSITFHPVDLTRHGKTPAGDPLWRVVWSDSRRQSEEFEGVVHHDEPMYPLTHGKWILERWYPDEKYVGMNKAAYEAMFQGPMFGKAYLPYPDGGEYECKEIFGSSVDQQAVDQAVAHHEYTLRNQDVGDPERRVIAQREVKEKAIDSLYETELDKAFGENK